MLKLNKRSSINLKIYSVGFLILFLLFAILIYQKYFSSSADITQAVISLDKNTTYQTITGWESVANAADDLPNANLLQYADDLFDKVASDAEINRVRLEVYGGMENSVDYYTPYKQANFPAGTDPIYLAWRTHRYATVNDNNDPNSTNLSGFQFARLDDKMKDIILPLKQKFDAKGEHLQINLCYVAFTAQNGSGTQYDHNNPQEYAEFILTVSNYLKTKYNVVPDTWEVILEPDNVSQWNSDQGKLIGQTIVYAATKLEANGYHPHFVVPSTTNMSNAITYFNNIKNVPGALRYTEEISYHRYGGVSDANLQTIASLAQQNGLKTSMTEWWDGNNTYKTLHKDLKMGLNSAWEQGTLAGPKNADPNKNPKTSLYLINKLVDPKNPTIEIHPKTNYFRQYYKFIRPGAVRIASNSSSTNFDPLAFINSNGKYTVEVDALAAGSFIINHLPQGTYGVKYTTASAANIDNPDITVDASQTLTTSIPAAGLITVYQKTIQDITPPSTPANLVVSYSNQQASLTWNASTDNKGVTGYNIYRNSIKIGSSATTTYTDSTVASSQQYSYEVSAYDSDNNESPKCSPTNLTIPDFQPPVLAPIGNKTVQSGHQLQFTISATDPDGNPITYSSSNLPSGSNFNTTTKTFSWTPSAGQVGVHSNITFIASDGTNIDSENIAITVTTNNPPVLSPIGNQSVEAGSKLQFTVSATDKDSDPLTYSASNLPTGSSFTTSTHIFSWTPSKANVGTFTDVTFTVSDGFNNDIQKILITVTANTVISNNPPVLAPIGNKTVEANNKLQFTVSATDPEGNKLTYSATNLPSGASFDATTRTFSWTPAANQVGLYSNIGFSVSDGTNTDSENIAVTVTANNPPILASITDKWIQVGSQLQFAVSATDKDGDPLAYSASNLPSGASFNSSNRSLNWTPNSGQVGVYPNISFSVSDGKNSDSQAISIIVTPDIIPPTAPTQFKANFSNSTSKVSLTWQTSYDNLAVTGYQISRSAIDNSNYQVVANLGSSALNYDDSQITAGLSYYYQIRAFDAAKNYSPSASSSVKTTIVDTAPPTAPAIKASLRRNARSAEVYWTQSTDNVGIQKYILYRDNVLIAPNPAYTIGFKIGTDGKPWYNETNIQPGQTYSYRVVAQDTSGNLSSASNTFSITVPKDIQISNVSASSLNNITTISWKTNVKSTASITYSKRYLLGIHLSSQTYVETKTGYDHTVKLNNIDPNARYDFQIIAINAEKTENLAATTPQSF